MGLALEASHVVEYLVRQCPLGVDDLVSLRQAISHHIQMSWNVAWDQGKASAVCSLKKESSLVVQGS